MMGDSSAGYFPRSIDPGGPPSGNAYGDHATNIARKSDFTWYKVQGTVRHPAVDSPL